jgi:hypothetical protein
VESNEGGGEKTCDDDQRVRHLLIFCFDYDEVDATDVP